MSRDSPRRLHLVLVCSVFVHLLSTPLFDQVWMLSGRSMNEKPRACELDPTKNVARVASHLRTHKLSWKHIKYINSKSDFRLRSCSISNDCYASKSGKFALRSNQEIWLWGLTVCIFMWKTDKVHWWVIIFQSTDRGPDARSTVSGNYASRTRASAKIMLRVLRPVLKVDNFTRMEAAERTTGSFGSTTWR